MGGRLTSHARQAKNCGLKSESAVIGSVSGRALKSSVSSIPHDQDVYRIAMRAPERASTTAACVVDPSPCFRFANQKGRPWRYSKRTTGRAQRVKLNDSGYSRRRKGSKHRRTCSLSVLRDFAHVRIGRWKQRMTIELRSDPRKRVRTRALMKTAWWRCANDSA